MDLYNFREDYAKDGIHRSDLSSCPFEQFKSWFEAATEGDVHEPNAMTLATVGPDKLPLQRTVLLKSFDERGFVFFTNLNSRKASHLEKNPQACALFPWITQERQVIIRGKTELIAREESEAYFSTRPRESQLSAWVSHQSQPVKNREVLENALTEVREGFEGREVPLPDFWGGVRIIPSSIEFWQGRSGRLHDRFLYEAQAGADEAHAWKITRLSP